MQEDNIKVVGVYLRVSTEDQAKEGFSLKEQKAKITEYCNFRHYEIYDYYEDAGVSAKTGNKRPEFERLLEDAKNKKLDTIMVVKLDRLSRSIYDLEKLMKLFEEYEIKLYCLYDEYNTTNANGRLVARLMMSVSQNEIERTSERTKFGMDGAIKEGHIPGLTPLGYRRENKCLVVDPVDAELVKRIFTMYSRGISHFLIAKQLTEEGIKGKLWHDSVIGKIIRNPVYKGDYILNRGKKNEKYYKDVCPRIVDDELWGIHNRSDYDLKQHAKFSGQNLDYLDPETNEKYTPYILETSVGCGRMFLTLICDAYNEEQLEDGTTREVLKLHPFIAPYKVAILPLIKKRHSEKSMELFSKLSKEFSCTYDESGNIGKRYRRQDVIGTPFCITIDDESLEKNTVTVRDRDTMKQVTISIDEIESYIASRIKFN